MTIEMADRLCRYRKARGLSQEELAARIGVSRQAVSKWERAEASPDTDNLILLAQVYGVTLDALVHDDPVPTDEAVPDDEPTPEPIPFVVTAAEDETADGVADAAEKSHRLRIAYALPIPIICTIAYLAFGFLDICGGWAFGWLVFLAVPMFYTLLEAIAHRDPTEFAFPVLVTWIFFWLGFNAGLWHPAWILFLTIPVYYAVAEAVKK